MNDAKKGFEFRNQYKQILQRDKITFIEVEVHLFPHLLQRLQFLQWSLKNKVGSM